MDACVFQLYMFTKTILKILHGSMQTINNLQIINQIS
jgi:hypothetical protein